MTNSPGQEGRGMSDGRLDFINQAIKANGEDIKEVELDLKEFRAEMSNELKDLRRENRELSTRLTVTEGSITNILAMLSKIEGGTEWIKRTITKSLIGGVIGLVFTAVIWLATN